MMGTRLMTCLTLVAGLSDGVGGLHVVTRPPPLYQRLPALTVRASPLMAATDDEPAAIASAPELLELERLKVTADDVAAVVSSAPSVTMTFESLDVTVAGVVTNLQRANITRPNALQRAAFGPISSGRDVVLHAWTGSGKTIAFLLPLLEHLDASSREPQALVLCPSRELAFQIVRVAEMLLDGTALSAAAVVGGANPNRQLETIKRKRPQLLVGTPGRVGELAFEWRKLKLQRVRHMVIDEVDDALRPPHLNHTLRLIESARDGRPLQLIFASATADTPPVRRAATQLLAAPLLLRLLPAAAQEGAAAAAEAGVAELPNTLRHGVYIVPPQKGLQAVRDLHHTTPHPKCLVFVNSPHRAKLACKKLWEAYGVPAAPLFGSQEREERVDVMRRLLDGRVRIAVTTEMGARGLDIPGLTHVVNLELPTDAAHYVHRAGRTGRAGADGTVVSIVPPGKAFVVAKLAKALGVELHSMSIKGGALHVGRLSAKAGAKAGTTTAARGTGRGSKRCSAVRKKSKGTVATALGRRKAGYPRTRPSAS